MSPPSRAEPDRAPEVPDDGHVGVLFVCLGNICRSPTAEVVFRAAAARAGLGARVRVDSAGTGDWHVGRPPDPRAIEHAARRGYDLRPLRARQVEAGDFGRFAWVLAMDRANLAALRMLRPASFGGTLDLFLAAARHPGGGEVPDPYTGGAAAFERALDLIEAASAALVTRLAAHPLDR